METFKLPCGLMEKGSVYRDVTLKVMTGETLRALGDAQNQKNPAKAFTSMLRRCVETFEGLGEPTHDRINRLLAADRDYIMFMARKLTFGPKGYQTVACGSCKKKNDIELNIDEFEFVPLKESLDVEGDERVFPVEGSAESPEKWSAKFRFPNGNDQAVIGPLAAENPVEAEHHMVWRCLIEWNGKRAPDLPGKDFMSGMHLAQVQDIVERFRERQPGFRRSFQVLCYHCEEPIQVQVGPDFFFRASHPRKR